LSVVTAGDLHWKIVSVYIYRTGKVMLKMKSKLVAGTITTKKNKSKLQITSQLNLFLSVLRTKGT
jgi:hypothetical protein